MELAADAEDVEVSEVEDSESGHDWCSVCFWGSIDQKPDNSFVGSDQRLESLSCGFLGTPNRDGSDEVGVDVSVVELLHYVEGENFVCVSEGSECWLDSSDDLSDMLCEFQVSVDCDSEKFG